MQNHTSDSKSITYTVLNSRNYPKITSNCIIYAFRYRALMQFFVQGSYNVAIQTLVGNDFYLHRLLIFG